MTKSQIQAILKQVNLFKAALSRHELKRVQDRLQLEAQKRLEKLVQKQFTELWRDINSDIQSGKISTANISYAINWDKFRIGMAVALRSELGKLLDKMNENSTLKAVSGIGWDIKNDPAVINWLNTHTAELVVQVTEETRAAIQAVVNENYLTWLSSDVRTMARDLRPIVGLTEYQKKIVDNYKNRLVKEAETGKRYRSPKQIETMVNNKAKVVLKRRCKTIAQTESNNVTRQGALATYRSNSQVYAVQWMTTSGNPCEYCIEQDGKVMTIDEFENIISGVHNGTAINCQCRPIPVTSETEINEEYWAARKEKFLAKLNKSGCKEGCLCEHCESEVEEAA